MPAAEIFYQLANDCRIWADKADSDHVRQVFLQLAQDWTDAALRANGLSPLTDEKPAA
jgi:hypothetical protein